MPSQSNFQDVVVLNMDSLSIRGEAIYLGTDAGAKSFIFQNDQFQLALAGNPTANETIIVPDASGTIGLVTAFGAAGGTVTNGQIVFSNSNSISFGINGSTLTASFAQSVQPGVTALGVSTGGNTLGNTGTTQGTVVFAGLGNITLSQSTAAGSVATINISGSQTPVLVALSAGTQLNSTGTVILSNSNGVSFGMTNSSIVTASYDGVRSISAGGAAAAASVVIFSNSNNVSFGANGATITATATFATPNAVFGIGVSTGGNTLGNTATTFGTYVLAGLGGITLSQSTAAGSLATVNISMTQSTAPAGIAVAGSTVTNGTVLFSNANNMTFGMNGSTITGSFSQSVQPDVTGIGISNLGNTLGTSGTTQGRYVLVGGGMITLSQSTAAGSLATLTISATQSPTMVAFSAGTQLNSTGTVILSNSNGVSFGMSNSSVVTASYDGVRSISAGGAAAAASVVVFSNSNGVSFGANGATITASIIDSTNNIAMFSQWGEFGTNWSVSHASMSMQRVSFGRWMTATAAVVMLDLTGNTNSSGALSISFGAYSIAGSTATLLSSGSRQISWTSGALTTASSQYGGVSGTRYRTIPVTMNVSPGDWMFAVAMSTSNNGTWKVFGRQGVNIVGIFDGFETVAFLDGTSNSSVAALPASYNLTNTNYARTGLGAFRQPGFILAGTL